MVLRRDIDYCYLESRSCIGWIQRYFNDCLCNSRDDVSFGLGLLSVSLWGIAEVPQIITNFNTKSCQGLSLVLLLTWILGDVFNLAGCLLEPSTLPTQFYTALLYTIGSCVLTCQCIYYDHLVPWLKKRGKKEASVVDTEEDNLIGKTLLIPKGADSGYGNVAQEPCLVPTGPAFYTSARSFASSPPGNGTRFFHPVDEQNNPNSPSSIALFVNQARGVVNSMAGYGTFGAAAANLAGHAAALNQTLLQNNLSMVERTDSYGQLMGWGMAVVYISGRIPQIWLNMKRGNVDGLSPCMFLLAVLANVTYVLSILVRSCKWVDIKANMPWLLDSSVCVSLDLLILLQFFYYRHKRRKQYIKSAESRVTLLV